MNIVLFGDSHLGRFGKNSTEQLEKLVENSTVYNCSAGGFTSIDGAKRAQFIGALTPDVVVFSYGGNDVAPWKNVTPKALYLENMKEIFKAFPSSKKILFASPDVKVADPDQTNKYNSTIREYRDALTPVCDELSVLVIDGNLAVSGRGEKYHDDDGVHMDDVAYEKVVQAFAATINSFSSRFTTE